MFKFEQFEQPKIEPLKKTAETKEEEEKIEKDKEEIKGHEIEEQREIEGEELKPEIKEVEKMKGIGEEQEREQKETGGILQKFPKGLRNAVALAMLGLTFWAGSAEAKGYDFGKELEKALGKGVSRVIKDSAKGLGKNLEDQFKRMPVGMGTELSPQEVRKEVREIQKDDRDFFRDAERARKDLSRDLRKAKTDEERQNAYQSYNSVIKATNDAHDSLHYGVRGCKYPGGFGSPLGFEEPETSSRKSSLTPPVGGW